MLNQSISRAPSSFSIMTIAQKKELEAPSEDRLIYLFNFTMVSFFTILTRFTEYFLSHSYYWRLPISFIAQFCK